MKPKTQTQIGGARIPRLLPRPAVILPLLCLSVSCAERKPTVADIERGRADAALQERAERLAMLLEGDFAAADGDVIHVRRMPEFGRGLHAVEIDSETGEVALNAAWIVLAREGSIEIQQWRVVRPERFADAWKDEALLKELQMYEIRRIDGANAVVGESAGGSAFEFAFSIPEPLAVRVDAAGCTLARTGEAEFRRTTPVRDLRPTP